MFTVLRAAKLLVSASLLAFCMTSAAYAEVGTPRITAGVFEGNGKLMVKVRHPGAYEGCYVTINGGLTSDSQDTAIVGRQITAREAAAGRATIRTARRYYCSKRNLYINAEVVCLTDEVAQLNSAVKRVAVPSSNVRR